MALTETTLSALQGSLWLNRALAAEERAGLPPPEGALGPRGPRGGKPCSSPGAHGPCDDVTYRKQPFDRDGLPADPDEGKEGAK